ncbi:hypothetical protein Tco_1134682 [Tanacetum coccineum]
MLPESSGGKVVVEGRRLDYASGEVVSSFWDVPDISRLVLLRYKLEGICLSWWKAHLRTQVGGEAFADTFTLAAGDAQEQARHFKWGDKEVGFRPGAILRVYECCAVCGLLARIWGAGDFDCSPERFSICNIVKLEEVFIRQEESDVSQLVQTHLARSS